MKTFVTKVHRAIKSLYRSFFLFSLILPLFFISSSAFANYQVGTTPFVMVDSSRPFDMEAYRFLALQNDSSGNTLPTSSSWCTDGTANCLIQGSRIIYGRIWYPIIPKGGLIAQALGGQAQEQYCDRYFGRDSKTHKCQSPALSSSVEYNSVYQPYQVSALGQFNGFRPGVTSQDFNNAVNALWTQPTGSVLVPNLLVAQLVMPQNQKFPLVIFSGGNGGKIHEQAVEAQNMAAEGYIVIVRDNVGNSAISQIGELPIVKQLNPNVAFFPGGVNPVGVDAVSALFANSWRGLEDQHIQDVKFMINQLKNDQGITAQLLHDHINFNSIGYIGYSLGSMYAGDMLAKIPDIKASVLVNAATNINGNHFGGDLWPLGALSASGAAIPGWPGQTINISSPAAATGYSKPVMVLQALQDSVILGFGLDVGFPISNPSGSYPLMQSVLNNNSSGPTFLSFVANANHFNLHSGSIGTYYYYSLLNPIEPSMEGSGTYTLLPGTTALGLTSYEEINFMNKYLKNQSSALTKLQNVSSVYPDVSVIIFKP